MALQSIHLQSIVSQAKSIPFSDLDEEHLGIDAQAGFVYSLNDTGRMIWERIAAPVSVADLCAGLSSEFGTTADEIAADVLELLHQLLAADLIQISTDGDPN